MYLGYANIFKQYLDRYCRSMNKVAAFCYLFWEIYYVSPRFCTGQSGYLTKAYFTYINKTTFTQFWPNQQVQHCWIAHSDNLDHLAFVMFRSSHSCQNLKMRFWHKLRWYGIIWTLHLNLALKSVCLNTCYNINFRRGTNIILLICSEFYGIFKSSLLSCHGS